MKRQDISKEFILLPWNGGIKLIKPEKTIDNNHQSFFTIDSLLKLPMNGYFLNPQSTIEVINETTVKTCGYLSIKDAIGTTMHKTFTKAAADKDIDQDRLVMQTKKLTIFEHVSHRLDEIPVNFWSIKFPWYDDDNKIIGVFGFSIVDNPHNIKVLSQSEGFTVICNLGFNTSADIFNTLKPNNKNYAGIKLTPCEMQIIPYIKQGKRTKTIAKKVYRSPRTIEKRIEKLKIKFNVSNIDDLRDKL